MKVISFNGSPRGRHGNTHIMVEHFLEGAADSGAQTENIILCDKKISHCLGCFACWTKTPGKCVIDDDMTALLEKIKEADIIVMASPVYVDNVTGILKNFLDRIIPLAMPNFETDSLGECKHPLRYNKKQYIAVISNCGFPEQSHFQVISHYFKRVARNMGSEVVAEIYRGGGELLRNKNILLMPILFKYKRLLKRAGKEVVQNLSLSEKTKAELEKPLISKERYMSGANDHWNKLFKK